MNFLTILLVALAATSISAKSITMNEVDQKAARDFFTDLLNQVLMPTISASVQELSALAAQLTAGIAAGGLNALTSLFNGKRSADFDEQAVRNFFTDLLNQVLMPTISASVQELSALAAQLTAGIAAGGLDALTSLFNGKRSVEDEKFVRDFFTDLLNQVLMPTISASVQELSALAAQLTAGIAAGGLNALTSLFNGKRSADFDEQAARNFFTDLLNQVLMPTISASVQELSALAAQLTAGIAAGGLDALTSLFNGKRSADEEKAVRDFFTDLLNQVLMPTISASIQELSALAAQLTAGIAAGGLDALTSLFGGK